MKLAKATTILNLTQLISDYEQLQFYLVFALNNKVIRRLETFHDNCKRYD